MKSTVEIIDGLFLIFPDREPRATFEFDKQYRYEVPPNDGEVTSMYTMYFRVSNEERLYSRSQYNVLVYIRDIGGMVVMIKLCGLLVTQIITKNMFHAEMISDAYQVQGYFEDNSVFEPPDEETKDDDSDTADDLTGAINDITIIKERVASLEKKAIPPNIITAAPLPIISFKPKININNAIAKKKMEKTKSVKKKLRKIFTEELESP